ncbi:MAG: hypothetical protein KDC80_02860 [Saprospiraceae bacterium]|nr:hypothetical protein [Saprospiraceae bacterium]
MMTSIMKMCDISHTRRTSLVEQTPASQTSYKELYQREVCKEQKRKLLLANRISSCTPLLIELITM